MSRGPASTPPAPAAPIAESPAPRSHRRLVWLVVLGTLVLAGGIFLLTYRSIEARWQSVLSAFPGRRAHKPKPAAIRVETHFDRNAVADSLLVGGRLIALSHSGALVSFNPSTFASQGERWARHKFVCIGPDDSTSFSAALSNGVIVKVKAADLAVSKVAEVLGQPEWIGRRHTAGGGLLVAYSNPRREPLGSLTSKGFVHKLKDFGTGREVLLEAPSSLFLDSKDRLWVVGSREKTSTKLQVLDLQAGTFKEIAGKNAWVGLQGVSELSDGQIWAFGGSQQPGGPASFITSVDGTGKSSPLWTASANVAGAPESPIMQIVTAPGRSSAVVISALDVVEVDPGAKQWKPMGSTGLQMQVAAMRASGRAHLDGERVIMGLSTGGFLEISSGQAKRHLLEGQDSVFLPTEIRPMAGGLAFYGYGGPLLYASGSWTAVPETVAPPRDLMGVGHGAAGERVWASLVSIPVNPGSNVIVAKAGPPRWHHGHMHGMKDTFVTGKWVEGAFKVMSQEDLALEPDDTFATPDGQLWNVDDQGLWNFSAGKWRMVMSMPAGSHGGGSEAFEGQDRAGLGSVKSAVGEPLRFVADVGPPWVGLPYGSFAWAMARLDLNEAGGIPLIDEIPVSIDGRRVQIRDAISYGKGRLLLATNQGLCLFDLRWSNCQGLAPKGLDDEVAVVLRDRANRVWLGGRGLWLLEDETRARPVHPAIPMLAESDIVSMAEVLDGRLALGLAGRGAVIVDVPAKWDAPAKPTWEPWDGPGSFEGQFSDQAMVIRPCKPATERTAQQEQAQAFDGLRTQLAAAVLGSNPRIHLGDEAALDRRADLAVYGPEVDKWEGPVVAALKKSPLWNGLGVSKRYGPRGSRTVDVKTCKD